MASVSYNHNPNINWNYNTNTFKLNTNKINFITGILIDVTFNNNSHEKL